MTEKLYLLKWKVVNKVDLEEDGQSIIFHTNEGEFKFNVRAECCSESWIESIDGWENIIDSEILDIVEHEIEEYDDCEKTGPVGSKKEYDHLQVYTYDIVSFKGVCTIDFRNDSNGYYGGWLELEDKK